MIVKSLNRLTQLVIIFGAVLSILSALMIIIAAGITLTKGVWDVIKDGDIDVTQLRKLSADTVEVADALLLGVVMIIIALGLYQLFVDPDIEVPEWLRVRSLGDLKEDLLAVAIVLLGVSFLSRVVEWEGDKNIIYYGVSIAAVLVPLVAMYAVLFRVNRVEDEEIAERQRLDSETAAAESSEAESV